MSVLKFPMSEQKIYIGIDPSLTATAIIAIDAAGNVLDSHACKTNSVGPERLVKIRNQVRGFISQFGDQTAPIAIEHYAMGTKWGREALGELGGVLRVMMYENGHEYIEIAPMQLKQFATGKGTAQKDHVLMAVYKKWAIEFRTNDEADAFVAAQMARAIDLVKQGAEVKLTAYEAEVINKILNPVKKSRKKVG